MVHDLLGDVAVLLGEVDVLERLALPSKKSGNGHSAVKLSTHEHRIEGLGDSADGGRVVGHCEGGDEGYPLGRILVRSGRVD